MTLEILLLRWGIVAAVTSAIVGASTFYIYTREKESKIRQEQASHYKTLGEFAKTVQYAPHRLPLEFLAEEEEKRVRLSGEVLEGTICALLDRDLEPDTRWAGLTHYYHQILVLHELHARRQGQAISPEDCEMNNRYKSRDSRFAVGFVEWLRKYIDANTRLPPEQKNNALRRAHALADAVYLDIDRLDNAAKLSDGAWTRYYFWKEFEPRLLKLTQALEPQKLLVAQQ